MAYQFHKPKTTNKPIHIILTALIAILAIAVLTGWLTLGYLQNRPTDETESPDEIVTQIETITDPATCLLILDMDTIQHYVLIQSVPESDDMLIASIPPNLYTGTNDTLTDVLKRSGPAKVTETVRNQLSLPVENYLYLTPSGVNKFLNEMENGVTADIPETIKYSDENGITSTLLSGENNLTAGQATAALSYSKWSKKESSMLATTRIIASLLNSYMKPERSLKGYFGALSNVAQTNLRIDHYIAYAPALEIIAESNSGTVAKVVELIGETEDGRFIIDIDACRNKTGLYH